MPKSAIDKLNRELSKNLAKDKRSAKTKATVKKKLAIVEAFESNLFSKQGVSVWWGNSMSEEVVYPSTPIGGDWKLLTFLLPMPPSANSITRIFRNKATKSSGALEYTAQFHKLLESYGILPTTEKVEVIINLYGLMGDTDNRSKLLNDSFQNALVKNDSQIVRNHQCSMMTEVKYGMVAQLSIRCVDVTKCKIKPDFFAMASIDEDGNPTY